ncbi:MAG: hypothetical protein U0990_11895 [Candidatus Nanopelagicales bacterium]|nr:hypothetical protein [Candidatus Nanopelagicales bacterium]
MTATALTVVRQRILRELGLGLLIPNADISAVAAGSLTAPNSLRNSNHGASHYQSLDAVILRPGSLTAPDNIRFAGALTPASGLLAHTGDNYTDTTVGTEAAELWYWGVRPDTDILPAINRALRAVYFDTCYEALSHLINQDGSMVLPTDTSWTNVGSPTTSAKAVTARRTPWGIRSYQLTNANDGEGTQSATVAALEGEQVSAWSIASLNAGTSAELQLYDVTGSADFSSLEVTHDEESPCFLHQPWVVTPTDSKEIATRHIGNGATADVFWNQAWLYLMDHLRINLPSHIDDGWKIHDIFQARPRATRTANVYHAENVELKRLIEGTDYDIITGQNDANPVAVMLAHSSLMSYPLFLQTRRSYAEYGTFALEADTTTCPEDLIVARAEMEILRTIYMTKFPNEGKWASLYAWANAEFEEHSKIRPPTRAGTQRDWGGFSA